MKFVHSRSNLDSGGRLMVSLVTSLPVVAGLIMALTSCCDDVGCDGLGTIEVAAPVETSLVGSFVHGIVTITISDTDYTYDYTCSSPQESPYAVGVPVEGSGPFVFPGQCYALFRGEQAPDAIVRIEIFPEYISIDVNHSDPPRWPDAISLEISIDEGPSTVFADELGSRRISTGGATCEPCYQSGARGWLWEEGVETRG